MHQSFPLYSQRLHWAYCALYWHKCLLGRFIHLQFSLGNDHEKLWWVAKLPACCQNSPKVNCIVIKCASQNKWFIVLFIWHFAADRTHFSLCSQTDCVITHLRALCRGVEGCSPTLLTKEPLLEDKSFHCLWPWEFDRDQTDIHYRNLDPALWLFQIRRN